jgi:hypothetical protein
MFEVMSKRCNQCLFGPNRIVDADRKAEILAECTATGKHFTCHKATMHSRSMDVCCRGFWDAFRVSHATQGMRLAQYLRPDAPWTFIDPGTLKVVGHGLTPPEAAPAATPTE